MVGIKLIKMDNVRIKEYDFKLGKEMFIDLIYNLF